MTISRIGMVGLGAAARAIHLPAFARLPLEVVGGADPDVAGDGFGFPVYRSLAELLDRQQPDLLAIATPPASHAALAIEGLRAGCHILLEKPLADTLDEADHLIRVAAEADRQVVVNQQFRMMRVHQAAKAALDQPPMGRLMFASIQQSFRTSSTTEAGWRGQDRRRTMKEFGTHVLDLCRFFFGSEPLSIRARMPRPGGPDEPDHLNLVELSFASDRVAAITLDRLTRGRHRYLDIRLDGEGATVETSLGGRLELRLGLRAADRSPLVDFARAPGGEARLVIGEKERVIARDPLDLFAAATRQLMHAFLAALDRGEQPPCHARDNRRTLALMLAAYRSAETGETIRLAEEASA